MSKIDREQKKRRDANSIAYRTGLVHGRLFSNSVHWKLKGEEGFLRMISALQELGKITHELHLHSNLNRRGNE